MDIQSKLALSVRNNNSNSIIKDRAVIKVTFLEDIIKDFIREHALIVKRVSLTDFVSLVVVFFPILLLLVLSLNNDCSKYQLSIALHRDYELKMAFFSFLFLSLVAVTMEDEFRKTEIIIYYVKSCVVL